MNIFEIHGIRWGWFEVCFTPHDEKQGYLRNSDYLGCDAPALFLDALADILEEKSSEEWLCWQDEPGAYILRMARENGKISVEIFLGKESMWLPHRGAELANKEKKFFYKNSFEIKQLLDDVLVSFSLYENGNGLALYNKHWGEFPKKEYQRIKKFAAEFDKGLDEYKHLFCLTY